MASHTIGTARIAWLAVALAGTSVQTGCVVEGAHASFARTLKVSGPVRLEVNTGSGKIIIRNGADGEVRIQGEVHAGGFTLASSNRRAEEIASNPPIEQTGNLVRLGGGRTGTRLGAISISYTVETPADTEVIARAGSGDVDISGLRETVAVTLGSGRARLEGVGDNVTITAGSGAIRATRNEGSINFTCGSGSATFQDVKEDVRGGTGSGAIEVDRAQGRVNVLTGS